jgi:GT2 family glycosyltransferase
MGETHALVVNNDTVLAPLTYAALRGQFMEKGVGIVSAVSVRDQSQLKPKIDAEELAKSHRPHPDFSCFMISRECYYSVGPFDERFEGAYCEDNDYHVRMHKSGWKAVCVDWPFVHVGAGTMKNADKEERARIERMAEANRRRFWEKWGCWPGSKEYERIFKHP